MSWFRRKTVSQEEFDRVVAEMRAKLDAATPAPGLKPGECECGHPRCIHVGGLGKCMAQFPPDPERQYDKDEWLGCTCQIYIPRWDDGGDPPPESDPDPGAEDPEIEELRRMAQLESK